MLNKKLKWKCRRGVLELDTVLMNFYNNKLSELTDDQLEQFSKLLDLEDPILLDWLIYKKQALPDYIKIVDLINNNNLNI
jgi:antitoxin CptB